MKDVTVEDVRSLEKQPKEAFSLDLREREADPALVHPEDVLPHDDGRRAQQKSR